MIKKMDKIMRITLTSTACLLVIAHANAGDMAPATSSEAAISFREQPLHFENDSSLTWQSRSGRAVSLKAPQLTLAIPGGNARLSFEVKLRKQSVQKGEAVLEYELSLNQGAYHIAGSGTLKVSRSEKSPEDVLIVHTACIFDKSVTADVETVCEFVVQGKPVCQMDLPERQGYFKTYPIPANAGGAGRFELGNAANGPVPCSALGMPVVGLGFGDNDPQLAIATDPYCGSFFQAEATTSGTRITVRSTYMGSVVPVRSERRTLALEFHRNGADGTLRNFYRTIPDIEPGAPWTQGIHLVYYDYLSEKGEGWFKDLKVLADRIPARNRGHVAVCLHGWYDYFQQYTYDPKDQKLLNEWTAFPGTFKAPMSLAEMHRRLKFAKDLGFRVLLYFADGTNSDGGSPNFRKDYVLKDKTGKTFPGWKGPDSLGQPWMMDPCVPELRDWYRGYLKALLNEYAKDVDGFVWDETFYIETNFISYTQPAPAYADRAMMSLVSELTKMVQSYHDRNPDLVFLASDLGRTHYALVANGTYQDSAMREEDWGPSMFANYRNCLWSCNWFPLRQAKQNEIAAEKYGLPQGVSNGWEDNCGPSRMPSELLDDVLRRFTKNVESKRERMRYLTP